MITQIKELFAKLRNFKLWNLAVRTPDVVNLCRQDPCAEPREEQEAFTDRSLRGRQFHGSLISREFPFDRMPRYDELQASHREARAARGSCPWAPGGSGKT